MTRLFQYGSTAEEMILDRAVDPTTPLDGMITLVSAYLYLATDGTMKLPAGRQTGIFLKAS